MSAAAVVNDLDAEQVLITPPSDETAYDVIIYQAYLITFS